MVHLLVSLGCYITILFNYGPLAGITWAYMNLEQSVVELYCFPLSYIHRELTNELYSLFGDSSNLDTPTSTFFFAFTVPLGVLLNLFILECQWYVNMQWLWNGFC